MHHPLNSPIFNPPISEGVLEGSSNCPSEVSPSLRKASERFDAYARFLQDCEGMSKDTLKAIAKIWGFTGYSRHTKLELLDMLRDKAKFERKCLFIG